MTDNFRLLNQILQQRCPEELLLLASLLIEQDMLHPALRCLERAYQQLGPVPELLYQMAQLQQRCGPLTIDWLSTSAPRRISPTASVSDHEKCNDLLLS